MNSNPKAEISEIHQDLHDFKETRESVNALLKYRRALIDQEHSDLDKINEMKGKALTAIDNLFAEDSDRNS